MASSTSSASSSSAAATKKSRGTKRPRKENNNWQTNIDGFMSMLAPMDKTSFEQDEVRVEKKRKVTTAANSKSDQQLWQDFEADLNKHSSTMLTPEDEQVALARLMEAEEDKMSAAVSAAKSYSTQTFEQRCQALEQEWKKILREPKRSKRHEPTLDEVAYIKMIVKMIDRVIEAARLRYTKDPNAPRVQLELDARENRLWPFLSMLAIHDGLVVRKTLKTCDAYLCIQDAIVFSYERKELFDLSQAKLKGSYAEQRARILTSGFPRNQHLYIFEHSPNLYSPSQLEAISPSSKPKIADFNRNNRSLDEDLLPWTEICIIESRCRHRDAMQGYTSAHLLNTVLLLLTDLYVLVHEAADVLYIRDKESKEARVRKYVPCPTCDVQGHQAQSQHTASNYWSTLRVLGKREMKSTATVWIQTLMCIPAVTNAMAQAVALKYPCAQALLSALRQFSGTTPKEKAKMLTTIQYKNPKVKTLPGLSLIKPATALNIYNVLHGHPLTAEVARAKKEHKKGPSASSSASSF